MTRFTYNHVDDDPPPRQNLWHCTECQHDVEAAVWQELTCCPKCGEIDTLVCVGEVTDAPPEES